MADVDDLRPQRSHRWDYRTTRDTAIVAFAMLFGGWEIIYGGGRPTVLSFIITLFLSPAVMRFDEARRRQRNGRAG